MKNNNFFEVLAYSVACCFVIGTTVKLTDKISDIMYRRQSKKALAKALEDDDDWGPVIVPLDEEDEEEA